MASQVDTETEIASWLKTILQSQNLEDFAVNVLGHSGKGDGYLGDIVFVQVTGKTAIGATKKYDFALKCSKRSKALRDATPMKELFLNEIYIYDTVLPTFAKFQLDKGMKEPFKSVARFYGKFTSEDMEVLVFENLKKDGFVLWDKRKPLTRNLIDTVIKEYGKLHAISVAMRDQKPEIYKTLVNGLVNAMKKFVEMTDVSELFKNSIDEACDLLKDDIDEEVLLKWQSFGRKLPSTFAQMLEEINGVQVITHGDCWNNNFLFKPTSNGDTSVKIAFLDWQLSTHCSPIYDLSYFLLACISEEDVKDVGRILDGYYEVFSSFLSKLGSNPDILYPHERFLEDWKKYSKYGAAIVPLIFKACSTDKDEVVDFSDTAEVGEDFSKSFSYNMKDPTVMKNRMSYIMKYTVENDLL